MPAIKGPKDRAGGSKSPVYTYIRKQLSRMDREEWLEYFRKRMDELQDDPILWEWINREQKYAGRVKNGQYQHKKKGRPFDRNPNLPDTRNMDYEI